MIHSFNPHLILIIGWI